MFVTLTSDLTGDDFKAFYWLKKELVAFCSEHGIPTSSSKSELNQRIHHFLHCGEIVPLAPAKRFGPRDSEAGEIKPETVVKNYKNDFKTRAFFLKYIGSHFKFTVPFHEYRKHLLASGEVFTYKDLADFWVAERTKKENDPSYQQIITESCEYNRFTQDFA